MTVCSSKYCSQTRGTNPWCVPGTPFSTRTISFRVSAEFIVFLCLRALRLSKSTATASSALEHGSGRLHSGHAQCLKNLGVLIPAQLYPRRGSGGCIDILAMSEGWGSRGRCKCAFSTLLNRRTRPSSISVFFFLKDLLRCFEGRYICE
jgi:hypothetical protein